jgi:hypothetical protein
VRVVCIRSGTDAALAAVTVMARYLQRRIDATAVRVDVTACR